ncbi:hypothetical protein HDF08_003326 [Edaphobacter lichenicola]|uniref:Uncharacterized protein n=1 Tax=Tunturiibacter lichenicola TaxID=2051959 RepID=A0A852VLD3_9BACT|nr:hypothetical protein [Edaphobacter lichenicola]
MHVLGGTQRLGQLKAEFSQSLLEIEKNKR